LGFALEFNQPCLVAESLAATAIHDDWPIHALAPAEILAREKKPNPNITLVSLAEELRADPVVSTAVQHKDPPNKVVDGLYPRAKNEVINTVYKYTVAPEDLERKTAEMIHFCTWLSGVTQHPKKVVMLDFFLMHSTNLSIFYPIFLRQDWISVETKCRLLEWKGRMDLVLYAACRTPAFYQHRVTTYTPQVQGGWSSIYARACSYEDDGHTSKLIRAIKNAEVVSKPYQGQPGFPLQEGDYLKIAHMTMDSVERMNDPNYTIPKRALKMYKRVGLEDEIIKIIVRWVRWCGIEEVWADIPDLPKGEAAHL
jgi:oxidoreductase AflY